MFQLTIWSLPPLAAAILSMVAFWRARSRTQVPGGHALRFLFLSLFCWAAPQAIDTLLVTEQSKVLANQLSYIGIALTPVAWFQFALTYSQRVLKTGHTALNLASLIPFITVALVLTNNYHGLIWADWKLVKVGSYTGLVVEHGTWFYIHAMYCYTLILMSTAILVFTLTQFQQHYQVLLAAIFAPLIGLATNLFSLSPLNPYPWLDITSLGFLFGICILDRGILQYGILNRLPVVRDNVVEQLSDPVLVIDHAGLIIDANLAAVAAWPNPTGILFTPINNIVLKLPLENLQQTQSNSELTINHRAFEVSSTPLDSSNAQSDLALVFRDITERQEAQRKLREMTDELERMAHTDGLTNLFNRRYFMQRLNEEFERVRRHGSVLSVLIFDLDHFKKVNDSFGHDVGDAVLVSVSAVANQIKRVTDIACRLGGEEFALLLPETSKDGAIKLANRLRKGIEGYPYQDLVGFPLTVSASIGVATACQQGNAPEAILKIADRALYKAKNGGRNMVCFGID